MRLFLAATGLYLVISLILSALALMFAAMFWTFWEMVGIWSLPILLAPPYVLAAIGITRGLKSVDKLRLSFKGF